MNHLIASIKEGWSWSKTQPVRILAHNLFGNIIFENLNGAYYRIMPENPDIERIAENRSELSNLMASEEFSHDWRMDALVRAAQDRVGPLEKDEFYCLKTPALLGGTYDKSNLGKMNGRSLIRESGHIAEQLEEIPDGTTFRIKIVD